MRKTPDQLHVYSVTHILDHTSQAKNTFEKIHSCRMRVRKCTRPAACILSYTHTRPRKARKEYVIEKIRNCRTRVRKCTRPTACIFSYTHTRPRKSHRKNTQLQNQSAKVNQANPAYSVTHTRPHKSRHKAPRENWNTKLIQTNKARRLNTADT